MEHLRQSDVGKLLSALNDLHSDINPSSLRSRLINAVKTVVESEIVAFDIFNSAGVHQGVIPYDPVDALTVEELQIFAEHAVEHPFLPTYLLTKDLKP